MYNSPNIPVDKGLGFDFSAISDLVKGAATVGLNVFNNQMQLKSIKAMGYNNYNQGFGLPNAGQYGQYSTGLPVTPSYGFNPNLPQPFMPQQQSGISTSTVLMAGGLVVAGVLAYKFMKG
jgi:hypothetical protein